MFLLTLILKNINITNKNNPFRGYLVDDYLLKCRFDSRPGCIWVIFWDNDRDLVADIDPEVSHACKQDTIFSRLRFDIVGTIMLDECTDDLFAWNWANLFVDEATIVSNRELEDVALDKL